MLKRSVDYKCYQARPNDSDEHYECYKHFAYRLIVVFFLFHTDPE